jgi:hypothetical protein
MFNFHINAQDGVLVATGSWGMDGMLAAWGRQDLPEPGLPNPMLKSWSDCAFLLWKQQCEDKNVPLSGIRLFFQERVTNEITTNVLEHVLAKMGNPYYKLGNWPGVKISIESNENGEALLGTPNGHGCAYFLAQHQALLGRKKITEIQVWMNGAHYDMLYRVEPVQNSNLSLPIRG